MENIRLIGWMWQKTFLRPLYWEEFQRWQKEVLPFGWSVIREPEEGADVNDYKKLIAHTNERLLTQRAIDGGWACAKCGHNNSGLRFSCYVCDTRRN